MQRSQVAGAVSALLLATTPLVVAGAVVASPAAAATCRATDVTVVVQFPDHTSVGCASGDPDSGFAALRKAGFPVTFATGNGAGALCQISGYPGHPCPSMPSANAYWAYFHAEPGGSWTYSKLGGGSYDPEPGTVEGWRFGDGSAPTSSAPDVAASTPTKAPTKEPTKKPSKTPTKKPAGAPTGSATPTAPDLTATSSATATPTSAPSATATDDLAGPTEVPTEPSPAATAGAPSKLTDPDDESSGGASWIWGVVLLGVLVAGGGAAVVVRRRG